MSSSGFEVVHDAVICGQDDESELSGWQDLVQGLLEVLELDIESWGDDSAFVQTSIEFNDNLAISLIINDFEFVNVSYKINLEQI